MNIDNYIASSTIHTSFMDLTGLDFSSVVNYNIDSFRMFIGQFVAVVQGNIGWTVAILSIYMALSVAGIAFKFFKH